jgi:isocitrate/isopropylmalate dehydrogenase
MLLEWLAKRHGRPEYARAAAAIEAAVDGTLAKPERRTADLGGTLGTASFARAVSAAVAGVGAQEMAP